MTSLKDIEYVSVISRVGGIQKAAKVVGLSQPALTKRLQKLEKDLQLKLFDRLSKGVRLTQAGKLFLSEGQKLIAHQNDFKNLLTNYQQGRESHLSVGMKPGMEDAFFRESVIKFSKEFPQSTLRVSIDTTPILAEKIKAGHIDFAMGALGYADENGAELVLSDDLVFEHLFDIPMEIFVRKGHPVLQNLDDPIALFDYPLICPQPPLAFLETFKAAYLEKGTPITRPHFVVDDYGLIYDVVERSDMWSATFASSHTKLELADKFELLGSTPLIPPMPIGLVKRKSWTVSPSAQNLINIMQKEAEIWRI